MPETYCMIMTTVAHQDHAKDLTGLLLQNRLAACVQHLHIESFYTFEGKDYAEPEIMLLIKTRRELYTKIEALFLTEHPYKVPELIMLPIEQGLTAYLEWINASTQPVAPA